MPSYRDSNAVVEAAPGAAVRVALLTPPGRGALAVVGVAGAGAAACVDRWFHSHGAAVALRGDGAVCFGRWRAAANSAGEELIVVRHAPDLLEVQCHGGEAAASAVIDSLVGAGGERVSWEAWLRATGRPEIELQARMAMAVAGGPKAARILSRQLAGELAAALARLEQLQNVGDAATAELLTTRLLAASRVGLRLTRPWRVVVAGPVNAGKSSLVNAIAGHTRSIVSSVPGTTRDLVTTRLVLDGWEADLVDTAGLRENEAAAGEVERAGIARAVAALADADLVLRCVAWDDIVGRACQPRAGELLVITKSDLAGGAAEGANREAAVTSAATGEGLESLVARIVERLVPEERDDPSLLAGAVPFTERQVRVIQNLA